MFSQDYYSNHYFKHLLRCSVLAEIGRYPERIQLFEKALNDSFDQNAESFTALPRYIRSILTDRNKFSSLEHLSDTDVLKIVREETTAAIQFFENLWEESIFIIAHKFKQRLCLWISESPANITILEIALRDSLSKEEQSFSLLPPFVKPFLRIPCACAGLRREVVSEEKTFEIAKEVMTTIINEHKKTNEKRNDDTDSKSMIFRT
jgi:predicted Zn-dependent protease with MMP-like domain